MSGKPGPGRDGRARGQTAVIAIVLLVGVVAIGSIGILLLGANATEQSQDNAEQERVKNAFIELQRDVDSVAHSEDGSRSVDMDLPDDSDGAVRKEDAGEIVVKRSNLTHDKEIVVKDIGAIVYDDGDVHYAYQAGAVWSGSGKQTQMVSAPNIVYGTQKDGSDPTLTFPITDLNGDETLTSGKVKVHKLSTNSPLNDVATVDNQLVKVKITSDYYYGWGRYFEKRYENAIVSYDHSNDEVTITLGRREIGGNYSTGLVAGGDVNFDASGGDSIVSEVKTGGSFDDTSGGPGTQPTACNGGADSGSDCVTENANINLGVLDSAIATKAKDLKDSCGESDVKCHGSDGLDDIAGGGADLQGGNSYYIGENSTLDGTSIEADLSTGNVTIVTDGDIALKQADIVAQNPNQGDNCCYLRIYFNGTDMAMGQNWGVYADTLNTTRVQVYGTSDFHLDAEQAQAGQGWNGAVYAPGEADTSTNHANDLISSVGVGCSYDVCFGNGAGTIRGAVIAGSTQFSQSTSFVYDSDLQTVEPTLGQAGVIPPPITYLHVSVDKVCLGESECSSGTTTTTTTGTATTTTSTTSTTTTASSNPPSIDSFQSTDNSQTGTGTKKAQYDVSWSVSDPDNDLSSVTVKVKNIDEGTTEATFNGFSGSGTWQKNGNSDLGDSIVVKITATDSDGNSVCWKFDADTADGTGSDKKSNGDGSAC